MARAVRARSDENVGPRVRANEPPDEHASEGARTPAPSLSAPGPRELRVRAVRGAFLASPDPATLLPPPKVCSSIAFSQMAQP
ncbi:UDP-GalNAc:beta-1,3-N-acetylgalactosaminyltransferase 1 isoform X8 [Saccopteryx bilineata]|uniref:UDP-GalNAc:beta-1, 3-N-acetylgalactosaminyltransferase 1 isoform X8 n=1 Tax=Saccopteryx bilineata TaxID=59482 RepID=UPI00338F9DB6